MKSLPPRIVDLLEPFRKFHCYHPAQHGSASIKAVLPAFTGKDYSDLAIGEGGTASLEFVRVTFSDVSTEERDRVRRHLEDYCQLDTLAAETGLLRGPASWPSSQPHGPRTTSSVARSGASTR